MQTNPGFTPQVPRAIWNHFAPLTDALAISRALLSIVPDVALTLDAEAVAIYTETNPNPNQVQPYLIVGTITKPDGTELAVEEWAGDLYDRRFKPNPMIDKSGNMHDPIGGPFLCWRDLDGANAELYWSVNPPAAVKS